MKTNLFYFSVSLFSLLFSVSSFSSENKITLALNWKPEPEFGGFYEAQSKDYYKKQGLNVSIQEGGSGTPTIQMLVSGQINYAIVSSEEIVLNNSRDPQHKVTGIFSVFEKSPYMIMSRNDDRFKKLSQIFQDKDQIISLQKGLPYVEFLIHKFSPVKAQIVPYSGGLALFEKNKNFSQQGFITSEFLVAQNLKLNPKAWPVSDEGFNPYLVVLAVREDFLKTHSEEVKKIVLASREAWLAYLQNPNETNKLMNQKNTSMSLDMMNLSLNKMKDFMRFEPLKLGEMRSDRWQALQRQMFDLKLIDKVTETDKLFQNF